MNDRELLELAAKAAGIVLTPMEVKNVTEQGDDRFIGYMANPEQCLRGWFNPLTDDGDALRLAVKLCMVIDTDWNGGANAGNAYIDFPEPEYGYQEGNGKVDRNAATRRAIVRAAAEIGKAMK